jgi:hypothetical protein
MSYNKKLFFWKDKSGRGFTNTFDSEIALINAFEGDDENDEYGFARDWDGRTINDFAESAEVGDKWENAANEVTRTN